MIIAHNIAALVSSNRLQQTEKRKDSALGRLSSGLRINQAADDAAGLAISEKMKGQIRGLDQAGRNIQDGLSLVQVADQGLGDIMAPPLQRMRELVIQAGNGALSAADRQAIQQEIDQLKREINGVANGSSFNGIKLLSPSPIGASTATGGGQADIVFLIDGTSSMTGAVANLNANIPAFLSTLTSQGITNVRFGVAIYYDNGVAQHTFGGNQWTSDPAQVTADLATFTPPAVQDQETAMDGVTDVINGYSFRPGSLGHTVGHVVLVSDSGDDVINDAQSEAATAALAQANGIMVHGAFNFARTGSEDAAPIADLVTDTGGVAVDYNAPSWGSDLSVNIAGAIGVAAGTAGEAEMPVLNLQVGANSGDMLRIALVDARAKSLGIDDVAIDPPALVDTALDKIDAAMAKVSGWRAQFGACENALEHLAQNVANASVNVSAAQSRIADADMAKEMMNFTREGILSQSGQAMLAQTNQLPSAVLQLLK